MKALLVSPPIRNPSTSTTVSGRTYTCAAAHSIWVPEHDANVLFANGWVFTQSGTAGPTSARPKLGADQVWAHFDTDLNSQVYWTGTAWISPAGARV